jgi:hypothetical protein
MPQATQNPTDPGVPAAVVEPKKPRKKRSDAKPLGQKMDRPILVKMTPAARAKLREQARRAGYEGYGEYIRALVTADRVRLGMDIFNYSLNGER